MECLYRYICCIRETVKASGAATSTAGLALAGAQPSEGTAKESAIPTPTRTVEPRSEVTAHTGDQCSSDQWQLLPAEPATGSVPLVQLVDTATWLHVAPQPPLIPPDPTSTQSTFLTEDGAQCAAFSVAPSPSSTRPAAAVPPVLEPTCSAAGGPTSAAAGPTGQGAGARDLQRHPSDNHTSQHPQSYGHHTQPPPQPQPPLPPQQPQQPQQQQGAATLLLTSPDLATLPAEATVVCCQPGDMLGDLAGLQLLAQGERAVTLQGLWRGARVAVQFTRSVDSPLDEDGEAVRQALVSSALSHPNVLQHYAVRCCRLEQRLLFPQPPSVPLPPSLAQPLQALPTQPAGRVDGASGHGHVAARGSVQRASRGVSSGEVQGLRHVQAAAVGAQGKGDPLAAHGGDLTGAKQRPCNLDGKAARPVAGCKRHPPAPAGSGGPQRAPAAAEFTSEVPLAVPHVQLGCSSPSHADGDRDEQTDSLPFDAVPTTHEPRDSGGAGASLGPPPAPANLRGAAGQAAQVRSCPCPPPLSTACGAGGPDGGATRRAATCGAVAFDARPSGSSTHLDRVCTGAQPDIQQRNGTAAAAAMPQSSGSAAASRDLDAVSVTAAIEALAASGASQPVLSFNSFEGFGNPYGSGFRHGLTLPHVAALLGAQEGEHITAVIMEYADKQSLQFAVGKCLFAPGRVWQRRVALRALLRTALEVAFALAHLHGRGVVHGALAPPTVLLKSANLDRRGFTAKVSDFSLARVCGNGDLGYPLECQTAGHANEPVLWACDPWDWTSDVGLPYVSPEQLQGAVGYPSDVYAFGVIVYTMATSDPAPYKGMQPADIVSGVACGSLRPRWPEGPAAVHPAIQHLCSRCWDGDPRVRPTAAKAAQLLQSIEDSIRQQLRAQPSDWSLGTASSPGDSGTGGPRVGGAGPVAKGAA